MICVTMMCEVFLVFLIQCSFPIAHSPPTNLIVCLPNVHISYPWYTLLKIVGSKNRAMFRGFQTTRAGNLSSVCIPNEGTRCCSLVLALCVAAFLWIAFYSKGPSLEPHGSLEPVCKAARN